MKTNVPILCQHTGEISYTAPDPAAEIIAFQNVTEVLARFSSQAEPKVVDLTETKTALISSDWWEPCTVNRWHIRHFNLPDWMPPLRFVASYVAYRYYFGMGASLASPELWFERLTRLSETHRYVGIKLLSTARFRSAFRQSMRDQLEAWLNDPKPKYDSPFSQRQWECVTGPYDRLKARNLSSAIYRDR